MVRTGEDGPKGITCLVIDKDMKGVSFGAQEKKLGWHSQPTAQVNFDEVRVPVANRVGGEGEGFRIAMMGLDGGRLNIGACSLGGAQRCLDEAVKYTKERKQFGNADRRLPGDPVHARRHGDRAAGGALAALRRGGQGHCQRARQDQVRGHGQAPRHRHRHRRSSTARCSFTAATAICRIIRSSASGATFASIRSSRAPTRSCG